MRPPPARMIKASGHAAAADAEKSNLRAGTLAKSRSAAGEVQYKLGAGWAERKVQDRPSRIGLRVRHSLRLGMLMQSIAEVGSSLNQQSLADKLKPFERHTGIEGFPMERNKASGSRVANTDDLGILSAIWILSCNDDNPIITYKSVGSRLDLPDTVVKELVLRWRELFRPGILKSRLEAWKNEMRSGHSLPNWISAIEDTSARVKATNDLSKDDVFRNQFRTQRAAAKSDIEIITWGLDHIDRLRKSEVEEREMRTKKWGTVIIPTMSLILAIGSVFATTGIQMFSINEQSSMKRYEVSFKPKQEAYSKFMAALAAAPISASAASTLEQEGEKMLRELSEAKQAYFMYEPFLDDESRAVVIQIFAIYSDLCVERAKKSLDKDSADQIDFLKRATELQVAFQKRLYDRLFGQRAK
jgi:hypothetical protein